MDFTVTILSLLKFIEKILSVVDEREKRTRHYTFELTRINYKENSSLSTEHSKVLINLLEIMLNIVQKCLSDCGGIFPRGVH